MLLTKEYPATHSMCTAWYFVDKDDNVAIFDFEHNGPIPLAASQTDDSMTDLCFDKSVRGERWDKKLNFTDEQVELLFRGMWGTEVKDDTYWSDVVLQIDVNREQEFIEYLKTHQRKKREPWDHSMEPVCLSKKLGIYLVDLDGFRCGNGMNNPHARYLFDSGIILRFCHCPYYDNFSDDWNRYFDFYPEANCPYFLYSNDWDAFTPHKRLNVPKLPMKLSQMPDKIQEKATRLNVKFAEAESVQVASEVLCYQTSYEDGFGMLRTPEGYVYLEVEMPSGEIVFALNNEGTVNSSDVPGKVPLILSATQVEKLKQLDINKDFESRRG